VLHACALAVGGQVYCWGSNLRGTLGVPGIGTGATDAEATPTAVPAMDHATQIFVHLTTSCAIQDDSLWCWGTDPIRIASGDMSVRATPERVDAVGVPRSIAFSSGAQRFRNYIKPCDRGTI